MAAAQASTTAAIETTESQVRRLKRMARKVLTARKDIDAATQAIEDHRNPMVDLFHALGTNVVEAVPGEGIQLVEPVSRVHDEKAIEAYIKRYRPDYYDFLFPPVRKLDTSQLRTYIDAGLVPRTVEKHISDKPGTPQLKRVSIKGGKR